MDGIGILGDGQAGFREGYLTTDNIIVFNLIYRSSLWIKLIACGVNGKMISAIYNLYDNARSCFKLLGNDISEMFMCNVGLRQGETLFPLVLAIY